MGAHVSVAMYRRSLPQRLALEGRRCSACGRVHFPPTAACPDCGSRDLAPQNLSGKGAIHTWTYITAAGAPPEFSAQARSTGGYYVAVVDLAEGARVTGQLVDCPGDPVIGAPVEAVLRRLYTEEGVIRYGFKFRPTKEVHSS